MKKKFFYIFLLILVNIVVNINSAAKIDENESGDGDLRAEFIKEANNGNIIKILDLSFFSDKELDDQIIEILYKADLKNQEDLSQDTLLMKAIRYNFVAKDKIIKLLIDKTDINGVNKQGNTALMMAVIFNDYNTVKILLESGADISKVNDKEQTALDISEKSFYHRIDSVTFSITDKEKIKKMLREEQSRRASLTVFFLLSVSKRLDYHIQIPGIIQIINSYLPKLSNYTEINGQTKTI